MWTETMVTRVLLVVILGFSTSVYSESIIPFNSSEAPNFGSSIGVIDISISTTATPLTTGTDSATHTQVASSSYSSARSTTTISSSTSLSAPLRASSAVSGVTTLAGTRTTGTTTGTGSSDTQTATQASGTGAANAMVDLEYGRFAAVVAGGLVAGLAMG